MSNDVALKMKQKQYEATVIDFVQNQKGRFIVVTDDQAFLSVLRTVLNKHLMLTQADILTWVPEPSQLLKVLKSAEEAGQRPIMFVERSIQGRDLSFMVRQFKAAYGMTPAAFRRKIRDDGGLGATMPGTALH